MKEDKETIQELDPKYKDKVLRLLKEVAPTFVDELVEKNLEDHSEKMEKKFEALAKAAQDAIEKRELFKDRSVIGSIAHAMSRGARDADRVNESLSKVFGETIVKSLNLQDADAGGVLIEGDVLDRFFDALRPKVAALKLGPQVLPMPSRNLRVSGLTGDMTSSYVGEPNVTEVQSQPTTGMRNLQAKTQMTLVPMTEQLISAQPSSRVTNFIENSARKRHAIRQDQALLRGTGSTYEPRGLANWAPTASPDHSVDSVGTTLLNILQDFGDALNALETANVPMDNVGITWAPRTKNFLQFRATDADNRPFFFKELSSGTFLGYPFATTTNIPTNLGGGSDESQVIIADFSEVLYGDVGTLRVEYFNQGSYQLSGSLVSAMERFEQVLRLVHEHDLNVEHQEAIYLLSAVTYGA